MTIPSMDGLSSGQTPQTTAPQTPGAIGTPARPFSMGKNHPLSKKIATMQVGDISTAQVQGSDITVTRTVDGLVAKGTSLEALLATLTLSTNEHPITIDPQTLQQLLKASYSSPTTATVTNGTTVFAAPALLQPSLQKAGFDLSALQQQHPIVFAGGPATLTKSATQAWAVPQNLTLTLQQTLTPQEEMGLRQMLQGDNVFLTGQEVCPQSTALLQKALESGAKTVAWQGIQFDLIQGDNGMLLQPKAHQSLPQLQQLLPLVRAAQSQHLRVTLPTMVDLSPQMQASINHLLQTAVRPMQESFWANVAAQVVTQLDSTMSHNTSSVSFSEKPLLSPFVAEMKGSVQEGKGDTKFHITEMGPAMQQATKDPQALNMFASQLRKQSRGRFINAASASVDFEGHVDRALQQAQQRGQSEVVVQHGPLKGTAFTLRDGQLTLRHLSKDGVKKLRDKHALKDLSSTVAKAGFSLQLSSDVQNMLNAPAQIQPMLSAQERQALVEQLASHMRVMENSQQTETTVTLKGPPIMEGGAITLTESKSAPGQFNVHFSELTPEAQAMLSNVRTQATLIEAMKERGITLHQVTVSQINEPQAVAMEGQQQQQEEGGQQHQHQHHDERGDDSNDNENA